MKDTAAIVLDLTKVHNYHHLSLDDLLAAIKEQKLQIDIEKVKKAYLFAERQHRGQKRLSGEDFINHPLFVAQMVVWLRLDETSVLAAILHDTIEEGKATLEEIEKEFGIEVALIVDGLTDVRQTTKRFALHQESVENFQKLLLASVEDIRVLIIRLCDKLHNALTIEGLPRERQIKFAQRVFHLYGPLAEYIGLGFFKRELEDIAFRILYPEEFRRLKRKLAVREQEREQRVRKLIEELKKLLEERHIPFLRIFGRRKSLYSIWKKMEKKVREGKIKKAHPAAILDQIGVTVLTRDIPTCYAVLGVIHAQWEFLLEEFDDYIVNPKPNGYRSLQTTIKYADHTAEIQIKTWRMHEYNEFGPASHIAYKQAKGGKADEASYSWVKKLVSWQERKNGYRVKVFDEYIFVVTPKGDIIQLEKGSTPIDFAYRIHTRLGDSCQGVRINGKIARLSQPLNNGDLVEIIKARKPIGPRRDWLQWAKMAETKRKIRQGLRERIANG